MNSLKEKAMLPMFWVGVLITSMCSWLLAVAVVVGFVIDRPFTLVEKIFSFASAIVFAVLVVYVLWRKSKSTTKSMGSD